MSYILHLVLVCSGIYLTQAIKQISHTDFVLVGALGDLSKKYLWQGIFELYLKYNDTSNTFRFFGCGLRNSDEGQLALSDLLKERITCTKSDKNCVGLKNEFVKNVRYLSLKTSEDFENLSLISDSLNSNETKAWRKGRIFYLAIPPSAYTKTVENLHKCCYQGDEYSWSRVALEKPFGSDKESANNLVHGVAKYFREEEIYLVDHYLAKSVVKQILPFRFSNKDKLEQLLRHQHVDRVEIVMKETIGVKGRIDFYDQYGVVRDVMQNHLTELLALVTMELPRNISNHNSVENNRLHTLKHVNPPKKKSILTGQYSKYLEHAKAEKDNVTSSYFTPTFGATLISVDSYRWKNVPFILVSGKHLDERSSYIRIVFKDREICLSGCNTKRNTTHFFGPKQIIFQIGHGNLPSAGILVSKGLLIPKWPNGITELAITAEDFNEYGQNLNDFTFGIPVKNIEAYSTVIDDLYNGEQKSFVGTKRLLKLWDIWSPIIKETNAKLPRLYKEEKDPMLNFRIVNSGLEFISNPVNIFSDSGSEKYQSRVATSIPGMFLGSKLVSLSIDELFREAANTFEKISLAAFEQRGVVNVAFSGGRTPSDFLIHVVDLDIPWENIHIWQVDERCVPSLDTQSNFYMLQNELLNKIHIPYHNIHPMPTVSLGSICDDIDKGELKYEREIRYYIPDLQFDLIILGLGLDGHTASLFSDTKEALHNHQKLVSKVKTNKVTPPERMTLTFPIINNAREVFVLVASQMKHEIIKNIQKQDKTLEEYPVLGVNLKHGNLTWFIDQDTLI